MKVALITDKSGMEPYYSKSGRIYRLDNDKPYIHEQSLGNECIMGFWNIPVLFDGWFLNSNYINPKNLPDIDLDLIFLSHQRKNTPIQSMMYYIIISKIVILYVVVILMLKDMILL